MAQLVVREGITLLDMMELRMATLRAASTARGTHHTIGLQERNHENVHRQRSMFAVSAHRLAMCLLHGEKLVMEQLARNSYLCRRPNSKPPIGCGTYSHFES